MSIDFKRIIVSLILVATSFAMLIHKQNYSMLFVMEIILGLLIFFSVIAYILNRVKSHSSQEIVSRTITWWWMAAIFMVSIATHRVVSFCFLGILCFMALREYFSLVANKDLSMSTGNRFLDNLPVIICYSAIVVTAYLAYIQWYGLYIILVPVYVFLLIPIVFVLQNRTQGTMHSLGVLSVGLMFFVFNLGHSLFMINRGAMVLLYCFFLTEARDVIAYWIGKALSACAQNQPHNIFFKILNKKIAPTINPKKTWGAGFLSAVCIAGISLIFVPIMPDFLRGRMSYEFASIVGFAIGILGLMGDLVFSMIKRDIGIKDTGTMLAGHGGIIDRVNSLVFTIPVTFHLISWMYA